LKPFKTNVSDLVLELTLYTISQTWSNKQISSPRHDTNSLSFQWKYPMRLHTLEILPKDPLTCRRAKFRLRDKRSSGQRTLNKSEISDSWKSVLSRFAKSQPGVELSWLGVEFNIPFGAEAKDWTFVQTNLDSLYMISSRYLQVVSLNSPSNFIFQRFTQEFLQL